MRCGYVALLGKPNAGKSTLLNACLGQKIAGVSTKPQTTRNKILGIDVIEESQIIFLDTPGIHSSHQTTLINQMMNRAAWSVLDESDYVCYLIDGRIGFSDEDRIFLTDILKKSKAPVEVYLTKSDSLKKTVIAQNARIADEQLSCLVKQIPEDGDFKSTLVSERVSKISAKRPGEVKSFREKLANSIPEGPFLFGKDELTDKPEKFVVSEMIREQIFRQLGEELPYGISVVVEKISEKTSLTKVEATIVVERESQKPIVIGKKGARIKQLGTDSRETLEIHFGRKVLLELFVRVQTNWINNEKMIQELQAISEADEPS